MLARAGRLRRVGSRRRLSSSLKDSLAAFDSVYQPMHAQSISDPEAFWGEAADLVDWFEKPRTILDSSNPPFYRWFGDGPSVRVWPSRLSNRLRYLDCICMASPILIHQPGSSSVPTHDRTVMNEPRWRGPHGQGEHRVGVWPDPPNPAVLCLVCCGLQAE